ncbi:hypothetical protein [Lelliottia nimipressuralis]|uniref:Uncharacterized protein n=1 Tax=Lelliottia nimipressuralis TaxID=69220 RepID=A0ABD4KCT6_9ENTR|nr:hypothetical protein [Lelliottia nimipressuralis]MBF4178903.1 hypothetical protein [Lelliottia nimipressuralis]
MKQESKYTAMLAGYDQLAASIMPQPSREVAKDPEKLEWAAQEGYRPNYDPNTDSVSWVQEPKPPYQQNHLMNLEGSMSPERLAESFPAFGWMQQHAAPVLQEIIQKALDGKITTQRAKELTYQMALNAEKEAWAEGKPTGSGKNAANFDQAMSKATKKNKVAG